MSQSGDHHPPPLEKPGDLPDLPFRKMSVQNAPPSPSFQPVEVRTPESPGQFEMSRQELCHQLFTAMFIEPDVPCEMSEYKPQNPVDAPVSFPHMPNMHLLQADFFLRYDASTLFYIFFYFPGSAQQFFAGKELKQRNWRYHTRFQTWFRRIGEPTETTAQYEVGKFQYFDKREPDKWCVRQRNDFKLEYQYLESN
jgi:CCR4-NOT transcription complex subunit 3